MEAFNINQIPYSILFTIRAVLTNGKEECLCIGNTYANMRETWHYIKNNISTRTLLQYLEPELVSEVAEIHLCCNIQYKQDEEQADKVISIGYFDVLQDEECNITTGEVKHDN